ncbi:DUF6334 family protein [Vitreoscilla massiliensis]|uniref:DUF6334 family protein n=1 Tax=Vitreoscilla massiliensis TaxID=1689272 RepID=A0ABY4E8G6_9NEIS|nr:DUF6334 family protein [Vitreoscilla massiliensis]UOO91200.1 DUF6334 family protein [Vitreoscilla massiliensis]
MYLYDFHQQCDDIVVIQFYLNDSGDIKAMLMEMDQGYRLCVQAAGDDVHFNVCLPHEPLNLDSHWRVWEWHQYDGDMWAFHWLREPEAGVCSVLQFGFWREGEGCWHVRAQASTLQIWQAYQDWQDVSEPPLPNMLEAIPLSQITEMTLPQLCVLRPQITVVKMHREDQRNEIWAMEICWHTGQTLSLRVEENYDELFPSVVVSGHESAVDIFDEEFTGRIHDWHGWDGKVLVDAWVMVNQQGYQDGLQLTFADGSCWQAVVAASTIAVYAMQQVVLQ